MRNRHGSYAIYRRILAAGVRSSGGTRIRSFSGECAPHQEPAGEVIGRTGVPMADEAAHLWTAQQLLSSHGGGLRAYTELLKYWRDESAHGMASKINDEHAYTSLAMLLRFAQFSNDNWQELIQHGPRKLQM